MREWIKIENGTGEHLVKCPWCHSETKNFETDGGEPVAGVCEVCGKEVCGC